MTISQDLMPFKADFPGILDSYYEQMKEAVRLGKHHDHRRHLFMNFLEKGFNVEPEEITIEEKVKAANVRGYIDALYKYIIFEFKSDFDAEREIAKVEIKKYFKSRPRPAEFLAVVSDGLIFEVYQYEHEDIALIKEFVLDAKDPLGAHRFFDDIILATKKVTPKSVDIATRFGLTSAVFNKVRVKLETLFEKVQKRSSVKVKYREWNSLLAKVYGEELGDAALFLKHTYLTVLSRLMVAAALFPEGKRGKSEYRGVLTGQYFAKKNLPNLAEPDFFGWAIDTPVEDDFLGITAILDKALSVYRLDNIGEDALKEVYQELVDPKSRHALGEYYTPDWIADLALERIGYQGGSLLDPACGSGTFLLAAIRRLRSTGLKGNRLVKSVAQNVLGIDVHPLAVMMSKANMLLGLAQEIRELKDEVYLPVYMADTLLVYAEQKTNTIEIRVSDFEAFRIPLDVSSKDISIDALVDKMTQICHKGLKASEVAKTWRGLDRTVFKRTEENEKFFWRQNFRLLAKLVDEGRNSIWGFILKNAYRPAFIRKQKVDYIAGNPPWLAYRYIKDKTYKARVKELVFENELLDKRDFKLFTQMDTSTLFFAYCEKEFLKANGTIAFVLPKTTILPSKQHIRFQHRGVSETHDFSSVKPLFNVRSVLVIRNSKVRETQKIPTFVYNGELEYKNTPLKEAKRQLKVEGTETDFLDSGVQSEYYHPRFLQGATLVPRCFWFIQPDKEAAENEKAPFFVTSEEALEESKEPWRFKMEGRLEKELLWETVLAKGLVSFGILNTELVFLPLQKTGDNAALADYSRLLELGLQHGADWMDKAEGLWEKHRKSEDNTLVQWLNYNQKLSNQSIEAPCVLLYNTSGTNLAAALYFVGQKTKLPFKPNGFIADAKSYYFYPPSIEEGDYLAAVLNSDIVNEAIKEFQPQGLYGERDIHRRPFEVCAIPKFDLSNALHKELSEMGQLCREKIVPFLSQFEGRIGQVRLGVRQILKGEIEKINKAVKKLLEGQGQKVLLAKKKTSRELNLDFFE